MKKNKTLVKIKTIKNNTNNIKTSNNNIWFNSKTNYKKYNNNFKSANLTNKIKLLSSINKKFLNKEKTNNFNLNKNKIINNNKDDDNDEIDIDNKLMEFEKNKLIKKIDKINTNTKIKEKHISNQHEKDKLVIDDILQKLEVLNNF